LGGNYLFAFGRAWALQPQKQNVGSFTTPPLFSQERLDFKKVLGARVLAFLSCGEPTVDSFFGNAQLPCSLGLAASLGLAPSPQFIN
jgi:hypothetical protein